MSVRAAEGPEAGNLMGLQVYAKHSIRAARSDFQGPTAAGRDIDLSDFEIGGDLTAGSTVSFARGNVRGFVRSQRRALANVFSSGTAPVQARQLQRLEARLDALGDELARPPATTAARVSQEGSAEASVKVISITAERPLDVVDLSADDLVSAGPNRLQVRMDGTEDARLLVRIHGPTPVLRNVGFLLARGLDESRVALYFPEATELTVAQSGGAIGESGRGIGIPASVVAPNATLRFGSALITGQVFAQSVEPFGDMVMGQVDAVAPDLGRPGFVASQVLLYVGRERAGSYRAAATP